MLAWYSKDSLEAIDLMHFFDVAEMVGHTHFPLNLHLLNLMKFAMVIQLVDKWFQLQETLVVALVDLKYKQTLHIYIGLTCDKLYLYILDQY